MGCLPASRAVERSCSDPATAGSAGLPTSLIRHGIAETAALSSFASIAPLASVSSVLVEERSDQRRPQRNAVGRGDQEMTVTAERRKQVILGVPAGAGIGIVHSPG